MSTPPEVTVSHPRPGQVTRYLNQLVARAHGLIYREEPLRRQQVRIFFTVTFPQLYRQLLPYTAVSFLIFLIPALAAFVMVAADADRVYTFLGQCQHRSAGGDGGSRRIVDGYRAKCTLGRVGGDPHQ